MALSATTVWEVRTTGGAGGVGQIRLTYISTLAGGGILTPNTGYWGAV
jgi:hypothetical protein